MSVPGVAVRGDGAHSPSSPQRSGTWLTTRVRSWLERAERELALKRCGGDQRCPWCRQWVNQFLGTRVRDFGVDLDEIVCGHCGGSSLWKWEMGFVFICAGEEPPSARQPSDFGDGEFITNIIAEAQAVVAARATGPASPLGNSGNTPDQDQRP